MLVTDVYNEEAVPETKDKAAEAEDELSDLVGEFLREQRDERGWSQGKLAFYSGVNASHISMIERGLRQPKRPTLQKLADALGLPIERFTKLRRSDDPEIGRLFVADERIESINAHLLAIRELDDEEVTQVEAIVKAMAEDLRRRSRARENAHRDREDT